MGALLKRLIRAAVAGFLGGAAAAASSGQPINTRNVLIGGGITGLIMAVGKAIRDNTNWELTP